MQYNTERRATWPILDASGDVVGLFNLGAANTSAREFRTSKMGSLLAWKDLRWPKSHIPIADDGRGGYFALDTTRTKAGDCPVVYFDHELADVDKKSGAITPNFEPCDDTFAAWLKRVKNGSTGLPRRKK